MTTTTTTKDTAMHTLRRSSAVALAALGVALGAAPAQAAPATHTCRQGDPPIEASARTSCPFANAIFGAWPGRRTTIAWRGWVHSPVTHRAYRIACRLDGVGHDLGDAGVPYVRCANDAVGVWVRFPEAWL